MMTATLHRAFLPAAALTINFAAEATANVLTKTNLVVSAEDIAITQLQDGGTLLFDGGSLTDGRITFGGGYYTNAVIIFRGMTITHSAITSRFVEWSSDETNSTLLFDSCQISLSTTGAASVTMFKLDVGQDLTSLEFRSCSVTATFLANNANRFIVVNGVPHKDGTVLLSQGTDVTLHVPQGTSVSEQTLFMDLRGTPNDGARYAIEDSTVTMKCADPTKGYGIFMAMDSVNAGGFLIQMNNATITAYLYHVRFFDFRDRDVSKSLQINITGSHFAIHGKNVVIFSIGDGAGKLRFDMTDTTIDGSAAHSNKGVLSVTGAGATRGAFRFTNVNASFGINNNLGYFMYFHVAVGLDVIFDRCNITMPLSKNEAHLIRIIGSGPNLVLKIIESTMHVTSIGTADDAALLFSDVMTTGAQLHVERSTLRVDAPGVMTTKAFRFGPCPQCFVDVVESTIIFASDPTLGAFIFGKNVDKARFMMGGTTVTVPTTAAPLVGLDGSGSFVAPLEFQLGTCPYMLRYQPNNIKGAPIVVTTHIAADLRPYTNVCETQLLTNGDVESGNTGWALGQAADTSTSTWWVSSDTASMIRGEGTKFGDTSTITVSLQQGFTNPKDYLLISYLASRGIVSADFEMVGLCVTPTTNVPVSASLENTLASVIVSDTFGGDGFARVRYSVKAASGTTATAVLRKGGLDDMQVIPIQGPLLHPHHLIGVENVLVNPSFDADPLWTVGTVSGWDTMLGTPEVTTGENGRPVLRAKFGSASILVQQVYTLTAEERTSNDFGKLRMVCTFSFPLHSNNPGGLVKLIAKSGSGVFLGALRASFGGVNPGGFVNAEVDTNGMRMPRDTESVTVQVLLQRTTVSAEIDDMFLGLFHDATLPYRYPTPTAIAGGDAADASSLAEFNATGDVQLALNFDAWSTGGAGAKHYVLSPGSSMSQVVTLPRGDTTAPYYQLSARVSRATADVSNASLSARLDLLKLDGTVVASHSVQPMTGHEGAVFGVVTSADFSSDLFGAETEAIVRVVAETSIRIDELHLYGIAAPRTEKDTGADISNEFDGALTWSVIHGSPDIDTVTAFQGKQGAGVLLLKSATGGPVEVISPQSDVSGDAGDIDAGKVRLSVYAQVISRGKAVSMAAVCYGADQTWMTNFTLHHETISGTAADSKFVTVGVFSNELKLPWGTRYVALAFSTPTGGTDATDSPVVDTARLYLTPNSTVLHPYPVPYDMIHRLDLTAIGNGEVRVSRIKLTNATGHELTPTAATPASALTNCFDDDVATECVETSGDGLSFTFAGLKVVNVTVFAALDFDGPARIAAYNHHGVLIPNRTVFSPVMHTGRNATFDFPFSGPPIPPLEGSVVLRHFAPLGVHPFIKAIEVWNVDNVNVAPAAALSHHSSLTLPQPVAHCVDAENICSLGGAVGFVGEPSFTVTFSQSEHVSLIKIVLVPGGNQTLMMTTLVRTRDPSNLLTGKLVADSVTSPQLLIATPFGKEPIDVLPTRIAFIKILRTNTSITGELRLMDVQAFPYAGDNILSRPSGVSVSISEAASGDLPANCVDEDMATSCSTAAAAAQHWILIRHEEVTDMRAVWIRPATIDTLRGATMQLLDRRQRVVTSVQCDGGRATEFYKKPWPSPQKYKDVTATVTQSIPGTGTVELSRSTTLRQSGTMTLTLQHPPKGQLLADGAMAGGREANGVAWAFPTSKPWRPVGKEFHPDPSGEAQGRVYVETAPFAEAVNAARDDAAMAYHAVLTLSFRSAAQLPLLDSLVTAKLSCFETQAHADADTPHQSVAAATFRGWGTYADDRHQRSGALRYPLSRDCGVLSADVHLRGFAVVTSAKLHFARGVVPDDVFTRVVMARPWIDPSTADPVVSVAAAVPSPIVVASSSVPPAGAGFAAVTPTPAPEFMQGSVAFRCSGTAPSTMTRSFTLPGDVKAAALNGTLRVTVGALFAAVGTATSMKLTALPSGRSLAVDIPATGTDGHFAWAGVPDAPVPPDTVTIEARFMATGDGTDCTTFDSMLFGFRSELSDRTASAVGTPPDGSLISDGGAEGPSNTAWPQDSQWHIADAAVSAGRTRPLWVRGGRFGGSVGQRSFVVPSAPMVIAGRESSAATSDASVTFGAADAAGNVTIDVTPYSEATDRGLMDVQVSFIFAAPAAASSTMYPADLSPGDRAVVDALRVKVELTAVGLGWDGSVVVLPATSLRPSAGSYGRRFRCTGRLPRLARSVTLNLTLCRGCAVDDVDLRLRARPDSSATFALPPIAETSDAAAINAGFDGGDMAPWGVTGTVANAASFPLDSAQPYPSALAVAAAYVVGNDLFKVCTSGASLVQTVSVPAAHVGAVSARRGYVHVSFRLLSAASVALTVRVEALGCPSNANCGGHIVTEASMFANPRPSSAIGSPHLVAPGGTVSPVVIELVTEAAFIPAGTQSLKLTVALPSTTGGSDCAIFDDVKVAMTSQAERTVTATVRVGRIRVGEMQALFFATLQARFIAPNPGGDFVARYSTDAAYRGEVQAAVLQEIATATGVDPAALWVGPRWPLFMS